MTNKKWANKGRGLRFYGKGKDVYGKDLWIQDGSFACEPVVRIYSNENKEDQTKTECLSLTRKEAQRLINSLEKFIKST